jgi:hypothetical protein|tara:strand:- start:551 stop:997 length:447 start_codon:yes stop_codon:yes gene_type:complete
MSKRKLTPLEKSMAEMYPPVPHDKEWSTFKWEKVKKGEQINPILYAGGDEIMVEQYGIIGHLTKKYRKDTKKKEAYYECSLIESRETGTGKFGEWLNSVKNFVRKKYKSEFAVASVTNQPLYKYFMRHSIYVAVDGILCKVKLKNSKS